MRLLQGSAGENFVRSEALQALYPCCDKLRAAVIRNAVALRYNCTRLALHQSANTRGRISKAAVYLKGHKEVLTGPWRKGSRTACGAALVDPDVSIPDEGSGHTCACKTLSN